MKASKASQCYSSCREFVCQYEAVASNTLFAHDGLAIEIKNIVSGSFFKGFAGKMRSLESSRASAARPVLSATSSAATVEAFKNI